MKDLYRVTLIPKYKKTRVYNSGYTSNDGRMKDTEGYYTLSEKRDGCTVLIEGLALDENVVSQIRETYRKVSELGFENPYPYFKINLPEKVEIPFVETGERFEVHTSNELRKNEYTFHILIHTGMRGWYIVDHCEYNSCKAVQHSKFERYGFNDISMEHNRRFGDDVDKETLFEAELALRKVRKGFDDRYSVMPANEKIGVTNTPKQDSDFAELLKSALNK